MQSTRYLLVGGGLASSQAAKQLRQLDPGASITIVSDERHPPYDRPPLSKDFLRGETPADKLEEVLGDHRVAAILALRQPWGTWRASAAYSAYLNDASKYNIDLFADADVRLFRGFNLNIEGSFSRVRNQLYLPAGEATDEEVLLRLRRLETGYRYRVLVGFSYQFGSIYNNVVNPRWSSTAGRAP